MKKVNLFITIFALVILLSAAAIGQITPNPLTRIITKNGQITPTISLEQNDVCVTKFYDDEQEIYGTCVYYTNYTSCLNTSGPNTACSVQQSTKNYECKTGKTTLTKNRTECRANDYVISIDKGAATLKKQIDHSDWGPCVHSQENIAGSSCLVVTCVSLYDGAHRGQFTDCNGGKSCQRFEICDNSIKTLYKNSRDDFVEEDPTFYLNKLAVKETQ